MLWCGMVWCGVVVEWYGMAWTHGIVWLYHSQHTTMVCYHDILPYYYGTKFTMVFLLW